MPRHDPLQTLRLVDPSPGSDADAVFVVTVKTGVTLLRAAVAGDRHAFAIMVQARQLAEDVEAAPPAAPIRCAGCQRPIRTNAFHMAVQVASAVNPDGARVALCRRCGRGVSAIRAIGTAALAGSA